MLGAMLALLRTMQSCAHKNASLYAAPGLVACISMYGLLCCIGAEHIWLCVQIREKEANLDVLIMPIDDMYALLAR